MKTTLATAMRWASDNANRSSHTTYGEQIADLIDLARRAANGDDVKMDAKILMSGILARAKR